MNIAKYREAVAREGITNRDIAQTLQISEQSYYNKINAKTEFKDSEIRQLVKLLHLSMNDVNAIFFNNAVN